MIDEKEAVRKVMSILGKRSAKKSKKTKEDYSAMGKKSAKKRWGKKAVDKSLD